MLKNESIAIRTDQILTTESDVRFLIFESIMDNKRAKFSEVFYDSGKVIYKRRELEYTKQLQISSNLSMGICEGKKYFDPYAVVKEINWSINNNIDIINYSGGRDDIYEPQKNAIENYSGLLVCSAGNDSYDVDINKHYPSDYSRDQSFSSRVISVGAIDKNGYIKSDSNYGKMSVSIFAPGDKILSTFPKALNSSEYVYWGGTSMATPFVTGTAALMFSLYLDANSTGEYGMS